MLDFIQNQVFRMEWLHDLVGNLLRSLGQDLETRIGSSIHFFIYDVIKITILLCVLIFLISLIQSYFPPERSRKIMTKFKGIWANIVSALLGTVTPFCSCSSIPIFIGFTSAGLPIGVTFSFLISSPMVDLGSLILLMTIFGAKIAILYVFFGLVIAVLGGSLISKLKMERYVDESILNVVFFEQKQESMTMKDRVDFAKDQMLSTFKKVFFYILLGVLIGSIIHNWIPEVFITKVLGDNNPFGVVIATLVGAPMYGDIFGAIPIAEALLSKGSNLGTVLAFMMAVTTLSLPSLIMLKNILKKELLGMFIAICTLGIIIVGYLFNFLQKIIF